MIFCNRFSFLFNRNNISSFLIDFKLEFLFFNQNSCIKSSILNNVIPLLIIHIITTIHTKFFEDQQFYICKQIIRLQLSRQIYKIFVMDNILNHKQWKYNRN
ncbi:unnamed protein product [Paramecium sonneborni]|uniref:Uncharacterized protein n=1 Tax=Paramecium sonneborni TaxID=65129 RepID=A0A8S1Q881_9CILI|nr:unnamed protein product [Paramecium sonneborni]